MATLEIREVATFEKKIEFNIEELPECLELGGGHAVGVRRFVGGGMDVQPLGAFDDEIKWDGTFWFKNALMRCLSLDGLRQDGIEIYMSFGPILRKAIITKFNYKYYNDYYIPYSITLQPIRDYGLGGTYNGVDETGGSGVTNLAPAAQPEQAAPPPPPPPQPRTHLFGSNDTLWGLAVQYYGDGTKWPKIAEANGIKNPRTIPDGITVIIPD